MSSLSATVPTVAGTFSPLRPALRLDGHPYSPALLHQIVELAARLESFEQAAIALKATKRPDISSRHVNRLTQEVGTDLARQRDAQAEQYRRRQLVPQVTETPPLAVVEVDGGRLGTRQEGSAPGVHQAQAKEDKIACLLSMNSNTHSQDPHPEPPPAFREALRVARLVRRLKSQSATAPAPQTAPGEAQTPTVQPAAAEPDQEPC
jgi:hypothetical protein